MDYKNWKKAYVCIDLKSFYASVECVERGLDPMTTDLVVADPTRSDRTICLAVSPSLKAWEDQFVKNWNENISISPKLQPQPDPNERQVWQYEHPDLEREGLRFEHSS